MRHTSECFDQITKFQLFKLRLKMLMLVTRRPWLYLLLVLVALYVIKTWVGEEYKLTRLMKSHKNTNAASKKLRGCADGKIRGVNLGGWLLLEPWITPTIFEEVNVDVNTGKIVDEWTYFDCVNTVFAKARLERHWNEFYAKEDLIKLADSGISHLRIPVGYWMFQTWADDPFPIPDESDKGGRRFYLKRLVKWAEDIGLRVILDLHGAPGSQNGNDHSGKRGPVSWNNNLNVGRTKQVIEKMLDMIALWISEGISKRTFQGISLLNEPLANSDLVVARLLEDFYPACYRDVRKRFDDDFKVVIDSFWDTARFKDYMPKNDGYNGVYLDTHYYHAFGKFWNDMASGPLARTKSWETHKNIACQFSKTMNSSGLPTYIGEWSLAVSDCQKYLHGGFVIPYIPPDASADACEQYNSDFSSYSSSYIQFLREFMLSQMEAYEASANSVGWFFWTAKTERHRAPEWDYLFLLENGIAPKDLCNRTPKVC